MGKTSANQMPEGLQLYRQLPSSAIKEFQDVAKITHAFVREFLTSHLKKVQDKFIADPFYLDHSLLNEINRRGFLSLWLPRYLGGRGFHPVSMNVFSEIISEHCLGAANIVGAHYFGFGLLALSHNYKIMRSITVEIRRGEQEGNPCILAAGVTEPTAGTDREDLRLLKRAKMSCVAKKSNADYELNGQKIYISNAAWARFIVVVTTTKVERPETETVIMAVPTSLPGIKISSPIPKWGQEACPASEITFESCLVPQKYIALAREDFDSDEEFSEYSQTVTDNLLAQSRAGVAFLASGVCRGVLTDVDTYLENSAEKNQEWMQSKVSDLIRNATLSQLIAWESALYAQTSGPQAQTLENGFFLFQKWAPQFLQNFLGRIMESSRFSKKMRKSALNFKPDRALGLSSLAKYVSSDLCHESLLSALEITRGECLQKRLRDAKLLQIYEGTNQLNRLQSWYGLTSVKSPTLFSASETEIIGTTVKLADTWREKLTLMRQSFDICSSYAKNREQGGVRIENWSEHRKCLSELAVTLQFIESASFHCQTDQDIKSLILVIDQNFLKHISMCMQLMGGFGYTFKSGLPQIFNRALSLQSSNPPIESSYLNYWKEFH